MPDVEIAMITPHDDEFDAEELQDVYWAAVGGALDELARIEWRRYQEAGGNRESLERDFAAALFALTLAELEADLAARDADDERDDDGLAAEDAAG